jgi:hypothetical protein
MSVLPRASPIEAMSNGVPRIGLRRDVTILIFFLSGRAQVALGPTNTRHLSLLAGCSYLNRQG